MNKLEISIKADELVAAMENLTAVLVGKHMKKIKSQPQDVDAADKQKEQPITIEQVRAILAEKSQAGKQPQVKALITKYGAKKLTDIAPERYAELLKEAEVL